MTPTQGNTPDPIYDERREQIKRAAMKVFARYGIAGTKMSMIAAEAGISQGLSYRYFSSKEELFTILVEEALEEAQTALRSTPQLPGGPKEQIRALTERMLDEEHKHNFMLLQQAQTSEDVPEQAKRILEQYSMQDAPRELVPVFVKGQEAGEFCEGDPFRLLLLYFTVLTGLMLQDLPADWLQETDLFMKILAK
ncbi:TetR/AcrR family transcriptional regulator [Paenibacillus sp. P26]|nr:TetR/AcrR family transcriptional regulator [Paenibacillus sp. P26]